jgi:hypothetical protein
MKTFKPFLADLARQHQGAHANVARHPYPLRKPACLICFAG